MRTSSHPSSNADRPKTTSPSILRFKGSLCTRMPSKACMSKPVRKFTRLPISPTFGSSSKPMNRIFLGCITASPSDSPVRPFPERPSRDKLPLSTPCSMHAPARSECVSTWPTPVQAQTGHVRARHCSFEDRQRRPGHGSRTCRKMDQPHASGDHQG